MILMVGNGEYGAIRSIFQSKLNPHENSHMLQRKLQGWVRCSNHPARRERRSNFKKISPLLPSQFCLLGYFLKRWNKLCAFMSSSVSNLNSPWHAQQAEHCVSRIAHFGEGRPGCRHQCCLMAHFGERYVPVKKELLGCFPFCLGFMLICFCIQYGQSASLNPLRCLFNLSSRKLLDFHRSSRWKASILVGTWPETVWHRLGAPSRTFPHHTHSLAALAILVQPLPLLALESLLRNPDGTPKS